MIRGALRRRSDAQHERAMTLYAHELPALMANSDCDHVLRTPIPYAGGALSREVMVCWRCHGWPKVPGRAGRRIRRRLWRARILARLGGVS